MALLTFDTEDFDTDSMFAVGSPTKITASHAGVYLIVAAYNTVFQAPTSIYLYLNGATKIGGGGAPSMAAPNPCCAAGIRMLNIGDYVEMYVAQNDASARNTAAPTTLTLAALSA